MARRYARSTMGFEADFTRTAGLGNTGDGVTAIQPLKAITLGR